MPARKEIHQKGVITLNIHRFEVQTNRKMIDVIIAAKNDESAFRQVDIELEKYFLKELEIENVTLHEKKRIRKNAGFVLEKE